MKKLIILLIITVLHINILPCYANGGSFVNDALSVVLEKIEIPSNYTEFSSSFTIEQNDRFAYLSWYGDDDGSKNGGQINVTVDGKYRIVEFSQYFYGEYTGNYKLSKINQTEAEDIASSFAERVCPEFYSHTRIEQSQFNINRNFEPYEIVFYRYENGIPCYDNYISVVVNAYNSQVSSLKVEWQDYDVVFSPSTRLTEENAKVHFYDKIGMVLEYSRDADGNLYTRYSSLADGIKYINAYTGSLLNSGTVSGTGDFKNASSVEKTFNMAFSDEFDFSDCMDSVYSNEYIPFDPSFSLVGAYCLEDNFGKYVMLEFADTDGKGKTYIVDKESGDVRYYYQLSEIVHENKFLSDFECRRIAELFCKKYAKSYIGECVLVNSNTTKNHLGEEIYYFNYARLINGMVYDENGIVVGVSRATGDIVSITSGWDMMEIPAFVKNVALDTAFETYINSVDFKLQYITCLNRQKKKELRPVYAPDPKFEMYIDSVTGKLIDGNRQEYNLEYSGYADIKGDISEEQIKALLSCGIFDEVDKFCPTEDVALCDYLLWICRTVDCKIYTDITEVADKLVSSGLVTYDELAENKPINMETGIRYIVGYLGYDEVAKLSGTYTTGFVDEGLISPEFVGYAAIAKGLKIFDGNAFLPKENMKRNVAAQIIYNLISN